MTYLKFIIICFIFHGFFQVIDLHEVQYIQQLDLLRHLNLQRNPIRELPDYRLSILYHLKMVTELDKQKVDVEEKVCILYLISKMK